MNNKHIILGIISGIFIGFSIVVMSFATKTVHPLIFSTISPLVSIPLLFIISFFFKGIGLKETISRNKKDFLFVLFERFIIASLLFIFGLSLTLAIRSVFVVQIEPVFVFLWSVLLLKERIRKNKVFLICTLIWGAFLITTGGNIKLFHSFLLGDLLVITALVLLSHSYIVSARIMKHANPMKLHMGFLIFSVPVFALLSVSLLPLESFFVGWYYFSLIVIAAIFFNVIGFPLWLISLKHVKPWVLASALLVQTIAGAILAFFWLGQTLSFIQIVGGVIILISVYLISLK